MKKGIALSLSAMVAVSAFAADSVETMFSEGKAGGQIRMFYIDRDDTTKASHQVATAVGGKLVFETASLNGVSLGTGFYTTNRILRSLEKQPEGINVSMMRKDGQSYSILGEAYVKYDMKENGTKTNLKLGRQKLDTPFAGSDDARMLPNLFEAYVLSNKDIENVTLTLAHVSQIAPGTFANQYAGGILGITSGYTAIAANNAEFSGTFANMGEWAVGKRTDGVTAVAAIWSNDNIKLQAWDYYAHDIVNTVYLQGDFKWKCLVSDSVKPFAAVQLIKQDAVGDKYASNISGDGEIDSMFWAVKAGASVGGLKAYAAYSEQTANDAGDAVYKNATITAWGGMPAFTQAMVTRHQFLAGTKAWKAAATYDFKDMGVKMDATVYYSGFDMDENAGYAAGTTTYEEGFDIKYYPASVKNLQLRFRGNFPNEYNNGRSWDEYRLIANYNF